MDASALFDAPPGADEYEIEDEIGHGAFSEVRRAERQAGAGLEQACGASQSAAHLPSPSLTPPLQVYRARNRTTGQLVALKHMHLEGLGGPRPPHVERELAALSAIPACTHVVALLGLREQGWGISLVLEHCVADLRLLREVRGGAPLDVAVAKALFAGLLSGLAAVHAAGFAHRDVAASNVLVGADGCAKLSDFGQARRLAAGGACPDGGSCGGGGQAVAGSPGSPGGSSSSSSPSGPFSPAVGTRWYKAPELLLGGRDYGPAVDLWSAGCLLAELLRRGLGRPCAGPLPHWHAGSHSPTSL